MVRRRDGRGVPRTFAPRSISKSPLGLWKGIDCSYRLRPTIAGETAGDGTIPIAGGMAEGGKDGAIIEGIILVGEVGCRVGKRKSLRGGCGTVGTGYRDTPNDEHSSLSDRARHASLASINTHLAKARVSCRMMGIKGRDMRGCVCCVAIWQLISMQHAETSCSFPAT